MKYLTLFLTCCTLSVFAACEGKDEKPGMLMSGGTIITMDPAAPEVEAMMVRDGDIVAVGTRSDLVERYPGAMPFDLEGRTVIPGVIDSHVHVHELGFDRRKVDLTGVATVEDMIERMKAFYPVPEPGKWLTGQGWDEGVWASKGYPDRTLLDEAFPDNPLRLESLHGFAGFYNGKALEVASIDRNTADPKGGKIIRRSNGEPTGVMEVLAQGLVNTHIPPPTEADIKENIIAGLKTMAAAGVTQIHEAGMGPDRVAAFQSLAQEGRLPIRVYGMLDGNNETLMSRWFESGPLVDEDMMFTVRSIKVFYDGSLGSRTALLAAPYSDEPDKANMTERISPERVMSLSTRAADRGFQMSVHAIGDEGNNRTLNIYEEALDPHAGKDHRWRIEHAQVVLPDFYERTSKLGVISSMQPSHAVGDSKWAEDRLGADRIRHAYAWRRILDAGGRLLMNSDLPGEPWQPVQTLYFAVTRKTLEGAMTNDCCADQALTVDEALQAMTSAGAYAAFQEARLGSLSPGKLADFVEIDGNPRTASSDELKELKVIRTWVAGTVIAEDGLVK